MEQEDEIKVVGSAIGVSRKDSDKTDKSESDSWSDSDPGETGARSKTEKVDIWAYRDRTRKVNKHKKKEEKSRKKNTTSKKSDISRRSESTKQGADDTGIRTESKTSPINPPKMKEESRQPTPKSEDQRDSNSADEDESTPPRVEDIPEMPEANPLPQELSNFVKEITKTKSMDNTITKEIKQLVDTIEQSYKDQVQWITTITTHTLHCSEATQIYIKPQIKELKRLVAKAKNKTADAIKRINTIHDAMEHMRPTLKMPDLTIRPDYSTGAVRFKDFHLIKLPLENNDESTYIRLNWDRLRSLGEASGFTEQQYKQGILTILTTDMQQHMEGENIMKDSLAEILRKISDRFLVEKSEVRKKSEVEQFRRQDGEGLTTAFSKFQKLLTKMEHLINPNHREGWREEKLKDFILKNTTNEIRIMLEKKLHHARHRAEEFTPHDLLDMAEREEGYYLPDGNYRATNRPSTSMQASNTATQKKESTDETDNAQANPAVMKQKNQRHKNTPYQRQPQTQQKHIKEYDQNKRDKAVKEAFTDPNNYNKSKPPPLNQQNNSQSMPNYKNNQQYQNNTNNPTNRDNRQNNSQNYNNRNQGGSYGSQYAPPRKQERYEQRESPRPNYNYKYENNYENRAQYYDKQQYQGKPNYSDQPYRNRNNSQERQNYQNYPENRGRSSSQNRQDYQEYRGRSNSR